VPYTFERFPQAGYSPRRRSRKSLGPSSPPRNGGGIRKGDECLPPRVPGNAVGAGRRPRACPLRVSPSLLRPLSPRAPGTLPPSGGQPLCPLGPIREARSPSPWSVSTQRILGGPLIRDPPNAPRAFWKRFPLWATSPSLGPFTHDVAYQYKTRPRPPSKEILLFQLMLESPSAQGAPRRNWFHHRV